MKGKTTRSTPKRKSPSDKYIQEALMFVIGWAAENKDTIVKEFNHLMAFKKTFRKYSVLLIMTIAAAVLILNGIIVLVEPLFALPSGLADIIIGIIIVIIAWICKKFWKI